MDGAASTTAEDGSASTQGVVAQATETQTVGTRPPGRGGRARLRRLVPRRRWARITLAVVLVAALGAGVWFAFFRPEPAAAGVTKQTLTISATTLKSTITASGNLEPARRADLTLPSGTVTAVSVTMGDEVTAGQTLATIDPAALEIARQSAAADLKAAKETLSDLKSSSSATTASINAAAATVQVKENALTQAETTLASATLTAPFDGIVAEVNVAVGDSTGSSGGSSSGGSGSSGSGSSGSGGSGAGSNAQGSSSSAAVVVISKGEFTVSTSVSSGDIASVARGLQAVITPSGASQPIYGTVTSVGVVASTSSGTSTFPVVIGVTGTHDDLRAGSSVSVEIVTAQLSDVIAVPTLALTSTNGTTTVTKLVDGNEVSAPVTTGEVIGNQTVITEGLDEGDQIVMSGFRAAEGTGATGTQRGQNGGMGQFPSGGFPGDEFPVGQGGQGGLGGQGTRQGGNR